MKSYLAFLKDLKYKTCLDLFLELILVYFIIPDVFSHGSDAFCENL